MEPFIAAPWTNFNHQQLIGVSPAYLPLMASIVLFSKAYLA